MVTEEKHSSDSLEHNLKLILEMVKSPAHFTNVCPICANPFMKTSDDTYQEFMCGHITRIGYVYFSKITDPFSFED